MCKHRGLFVYVCGHMWIHACVCVYTWVRTCEGAHECMFAYIYTRRYMGTYTYECMLLMLPYMGMYLHI